MQFLFSKVFSKTYVLHMKSDFKSWGHTTEGLWFSKNFGFSQFSPKFLQNLALKLAPSRQLFASNRSSFHKESPIWPLRWPFLLF